MSGHLFAALPDHLIRAGLGLAIGALLGFAARRGRFCTLGAVEDAVYAGDTRRLRAWGVAIAVAMLGVAALRFGGGLDLRASIYADGRLELGPLVLGGLTFGLGMALAGNCAFGSLLRLGGGDLKALVVVLVVALSAETAMRGLTAIARIALVDPIAIDLPGAHGQLLPDLLALRGPAAFALSAAIAAALLLLALRGAAIRRDHRLFAAGLCIGVCVVGGWWATGLAGHDPFGTERPVSFSFARPLGDTALYAMLASGMKLDFAVGSIAGVLLGAFLEALQAGAFRWEAPDDAREMRRHVFGAFLMGTGGVTALGCTIGQGVAGISTLSVGSAIALATIALGARAGLFVLVERTPSMRRGGRWRRLPYFLSDPKLDASRSRNSR